MANYGMQTHKHGNEFKPKPGETRLEAARRELKAANARLVNCNTPSAVAAHDRARAEYLEAKKASKF